MSDIQAYVNGSWSRQADVEALEERLRKAEAALEEIAKLPPEYGGLGSAIASSYFQAESKIPLDASGPP